MKSEKFKVKNKQGAPASPGRPAIDVIPSERSESRNLAVDAAANRTEKPLDSLRSLGVTGGKGLP